MECSTSTTKPNAPGDSLRVVGLFAGIGGIELGLHQAGHITELICEVDPAAQRVLRTQFESVPLVSDVRELASIPTVDLVAAGFPCQDLSQAGRTAGIHGSNSGLVEHVFRLIEGPTSNVRWVLLENVPFMLHLDRGRAMRFLTQSLADRGFSWAYRIIDTRSFGLPHRRQRVILLASRTEDPRGVLLTQDAGEPPTENLESVACGFYWTEGLKGLGWAVDAVPTIKGGSSIGIPSPPGIWMPDGRIVTPDIRDAERMQGFDSNWTESAALITGKKTSRWKLVGNEVSVPVAKWVGEQLRAPKAYDSSRDYALPDGAAWPKAAWGIAGVNGVAQVSVWPVHEPRQHLTDFLKFDATPLPERASVGFRERTRVSTLRFEPEFLDAVDAHIARMQKQAARKHQAT